MSQALTSQTAAPQAQKSQAPGVAEHFDVLIVGAGLSGIGAGYHLQRRLPGQDATLSSRGARRSAAPGTCSAIRACAPTATCSLSAIRSGPGPIPRPSPTGPRSCATSATRRATTASTATSASGIASRAPHGRRATAAGRVEAERGESGERVRFTCQLPVHVQRLLRLRGRLRAGVSGPRTLQGGRIVHPQKWPEDIDYAGKRVVVIGSGATAVTLVPAMADTGRRTSPCCSARRPTAWRGRPRTRAPTGSAAISPPSSPTRSCAGRTCCGACTCTGSASASPSA